MSKVSGEFREGWKAIVGTFLGVAGGFSSLFFYSVGLFLRPMSVEFGWTRGEASLQAVAIAAANFIAVPIAGRLVDRMGSLRPALFSLFALSIGFLALGTMVQGIFSFLLLTALATFLSAASNPVGFNRILIARFTVGRGLALGLALTAIGFGATILPITLGPFIAAHGWRAGYLALAAAVLPFILGMVIMLRGIELQGSKVAVELVPLRTILFCRPFATIALLIFLIAVAELGTVVHLVPMLIDRGLSAAEAGLIASALGLAVLGGRLLTGRLLDILDAGLVTAGVVGLSAIGMLLLLSGNSLLLVPGAILAGFGLGCESDLIAFLIGRRFPLRCFGSAYGCAFSAHVVGAGVGPVLAGSLFDLHGNYRLWLFTAAIALLAAAALALATERGKVAAAL